MMTVIPALFIALIFLFAFGDAPQADEPRMASAGEQSGTDPPDPIPEISGMAFVPPGEFLMGSTPDDLRKQAEIDEFPQRTIWVDGFYMDMHEVTNAQYKVFVDSMRIKPPSRWKDGNYPIGRDGYPVVNISWEDAAAYARFVGKRLPSEAEWEKAARGDDGRRFPWGDEFDDDKANNGELMLPIMRFPDGVSPYGLYDMAGNAAEWVDAWYAPYPRSEVDVLEPIECIVVDRGTTLEDSSAAATARRRGPALAGEMWASAARWIPPGRNSLFVKFYLPAA
jgi:formylglycine-generating enzyme required for sulfatase activity